MTAALATAPAPAPATTPELPGPLAALAPFLEHYGYLAVGLLVLLDNAALPVPGQTVLILAAVYAGAGRLSLAGVVTVALAAAVLGDSLGYLLGRSGGRALVHRWGRYVGLTAARQQKAEEFFTRNGGKVVVVARFIDGLRQTNGIIAGTTEMPWRRFLLWNTLGAVLWVGAWSSAGYLAGSDIGEVYHQALRYQLLLLAVAAALVIALVLRRVIRARRRG
ncbi:DedA family protein [Kitasatospora viridis]|uniref:Membrane protein DedA with SNARE-associated domain n=1 Tax=Kitasatospora viridis TaxID=281105 RepID=A0A561UBG5_9ACTN|nr:DedA family protein [Kitasatospora viridis]TWF96702.1 membrane protein DedA with SNARE-associated domain [Kitasatospora viridis]